MVTGSQQLVDDYEQLKNTLELYPSVKIVTVGGQPPDNYEILYNLRGYIRNADGSVEVDTQHRVRVSLPFGYPHFAPTAKPLTPIFHPDIDPDAIRIASRWQENPSLPDLILHIGEMICATVYNLEDPFNQEAADWYADHLDDLPLDSLNIADIVEPDSPIDDLVDDTFASLGLDDEELLPEAPPAPPTKAQKPQLDAKRFNVIKRLIQDRQIFAANKMLGEVMQNHVVPELETMQQEIGKAMRKTDQMLKLAEQLEDMGKLDEAVEVLDNLGEVASDAPEVDRIRTRILESAKLNDTLGLGQAVDETGPEETSRKRKPKAAPAHPVPEEEPKPAKEKRSLSLPRPEIPMKLVVAAVLVLGLAIGSTSLYFKDQKVLTTAQASIIESRLLAGKGEFIKAERLAKKALSSLNSLTVLRFKKGSLSQEINMLLQSREFEEGLAGRVLYDNEYMPIIEANARKELAAMTEQGRSLMEQQKGTEALAIFQQALQFCRDNGLTKEMAEIEQAIKTLKFSQVLTSAESAELKKNWEEAAETYRQALAMSSEDGTDVDLETITSKLTAATVRREMGASMQSFNQAQWNEAIAKLEQAQRLIQENPEAVSEKEQQDLERLLAHAHLYQLLGQARQAYEERNWQGAIEGYEQSLQLLENQEGKFETGVTDSMAQITKTLFMVRIAKQQDAIVLAQQQQDVKQEIQLLESTLGMIRNSPLRKDSEVRAISSKLSSQLASVRQEYDLSSKIAYLEDRYEQIFRANYPTYKGSQLLKPKAELYQKDDTTMVFRLTCVERASGRSTRLELFYQYNQDSGEWSIYHLR